MQVILKYHRPLVVGLHLLLIVLANYLAFWLRFDGAIPNEEWQLFVQMLPWLVVLRGAIFIPFRLYEGLWRYTSIGDLRNIIGGVLASTFVFYVIVHWGLSLTAYPKTVFLIDSMLLVSLLGGVRLARRIYRGFGYPDRKKRILIYGAGDAGEMVVRDIKNNPFYEYEPIGFIDDDTNKTGRWIHGIKVFGTRETLSRIFEEQKPHAVLVAISRAEPAVIRKVVKALESYKVPIKTLPNLRDVLGGQIEVSQIRNLAIEDLLERAPVGLDAEPLRHLINGKRVLVTGAGGSIGSELCRQIAALNPSALVLFDRYENGLFAVANELRSSYGGVQAHAVVGDVTDKARVCRIMAEHQPQIVFHAAAHKHVPLMEASPCEAVKNNVGGTRTLAEAAQEFHVERFILISTDKAVNPTSVMGASKRVAELVVQRLSRESRTIFATVRFGNVLGSNGSVIPLFMEQIKAGGPVTVTHPEVRRYFMLIPEAVHLVLHAAVLAKGGEIFVLDMGEQIKVLDMTRNLIRLSGYVPEQEVPITFVGLRPGEKLFEELVGRDETVEDSSVRGVLQIQPDSLPDAHLFFHKVVDLERIAAEGKARILIEQLCDLVSTYSPQGLKNEEWAEEVAQRLVKMQNVFVSHRRTHVSGKGAVEKAEARSVGLPDFVAPPNGAGCRPASQSNAAYE